MAKRTRKVLNKEEESKVKGLEKPKIKLQTSKLSTVRKGVYNSALKGLSPIKLANMLKDAKEGRTQAFLSLAEEMEERDSQYRTVLNTRKLQVTSTPFGLTQVKDSSKSKEIYEFTQKIIDAPIFSKMLFELLDGLGKGFSVVEINYKVNKGKVLPKEYIKHPAEWFTYDSENREVVLLEDTDKTSKLDPLKTIVHIPTLKSGLPIRGALAFAACSIFILKNYAIKDWAAILEVFGMPIRVGKYGEMATDDDIKELADAVAGIGTDAAAVISADMTIEFQNGLINGNTQTFPNFVDYLEAQLSKVVLGQTMTTDDGGSYSQANVHQNTQDYIKKSDCLDLAETINKGLIIPLIDYNFGEQEEYPQLFFNFEKEEDKDQLVRMVTALNPLVKGEISKSNLLERLGLEKPTGEDDWLDISAPMQFGNSEFAHYQGKRTVLNAEDKIDKQVDSELDNSNTVIKPMIDDIEKLLNDSESIEGAIGKIEKASLDTSKLEKSLFKSSIQEREKLKAKDKK